MVLRRICNVFHVDQVFPLGHGGSGECIARAHSKVEAVAQAAVPENAPVLYLCLGLAGYYSHFVPHYVDIENY